MRIFLLVSLLALAVAGQAQVPLDTFLGDRAGYALVDQPVDRTSLEDLASFRFAPSTDAVPNLNQGNNAAWARVILPVSDEPLVLALESGFFEEVRWIHMQADGTVVEHRSRRYDPVGTHDHFLHHTLTIPPGTAGVVYMGLQTPRFRILPMRLTTQSTYTNRVRNLTGFWALFFGIIAVVIIYNLWYFFWFRDRVYLAYIAYAVTVSLAQGIIGGATGAFFFGESAWWYSHDVQVIVPLSVFGCVWFIVVFLRLRETLPWMFRALQVLCVSAAASLVVGIVAPSPAVYQWIDLNSLVGVMMAFGWCVVLVRRGMTRARWFLVAWTIFLVGMIIYILKDFGVLPYTPFSVYAMPVGALVEMGLITAILASQIRDLRVSKDQISLKLSRLEDQRRKENFNIQMAKLRSEMLSNQMSPHFIFNVMSSIQVYIAKNDIDASVRYLGKFAKLMRRVLEGAREEEASLEDELELVTEYVELESIRGNAPIHFDVQLDAELELELLRVPTMVLQPVVENAIRHGFRGMIERTPELVLAVRQVEGGLEITVRDNGLGFSPRRGQGKKSHALNILHERSEALREQGRFDVSLDVHHLRDQGGHGIEVVIRIVELQAQHVS